MATPAFACLRSSFPDAVICGLIRPYARGVVENGVWFDRLIEMQDKTASGFWQVIGSLRRLDPDLAIILPNSLRSALVARLGGARRVYGYRRSGRSALLTGGPRPRTGPDGILPVPMVDYYLEICRWLGLPIPVCTRPQLYIAEELQCKADGLLERYGVAPDAMVIGINPGAKFGSSKCWPAENFARLAELLAERWHCRLMLFTGPGEEELGRRIVALSSAPIIDTAPDRVDLSLLKPLIKRCQLLVANDTGPRHYAVAFDVPVVVIMGPTDPRYTAAHLERTFVVRQPLDCAPCHRKSCPEDHRCMRSVTPEMVLNGCESVLKKSA